MYCAALIRRERIVKYSHTEQTLRVPGWAPIPAEHARAACLARGVPASRQDGNLVVQRRGLGHGRDVDRIAGSSRSDAGELAMNDPFRIFDNLREAYLRYLDSPFRLRYRALMEERRQLLDQDRQLYRRPLFEPVVPYEVSTSAIHAAARQVGASPDVGDYVASSGMFPAKRTLFQHQLDAWAASKNGDPVVVTTGTGSGKTECYLLPVFAYLVEESAGWRCPCKTLAQSALVEPSRRTPQPATQSRHGAPEGVACIVPVSAECADRRPTCTHQARLRQRGSAGLARRQPQRKPILVWTIHGRNACIGGADEQQQKARIETSSARHARRMAPSPTVSDDNRKRRNTVVLPGPGGLRNVVPLGHAGGPARTS